MYNLLSNRYKDNGKECFILTERQVLARDAIKNKLQGNVYKTQKVACPCCEKNNYAILSQKDSYGFPVHVVLCKSCGLIYNNPRLGDESLAPFYDEEYKNLDRVFPEIQDYVDLELEKGKMIEKFLSDHYVLEKINNKIVIEIGCGAGGVIRHFSNINFKVLGCDLSYQNVNYAKNVLGLEVYHGNIDKIEEAVSSNNLSVGLVIYEQVFEHLPNPKNELDKIKKLIDNESIIYIGVPGLKNIHNHYQSNFLRYLQLPHLIHFDLESLTNIFGSKGFRLIAGNQVVQALFNLGEKQIVLQNGCESSLVSLKKLEKTYKEQQILKFFKNLPLNIILFLGRYIKKILLNAPFLSTKTKARVSKLIFLIRKKLS